MSKNKLDQGVKRKINAFVKEQFFIINDVIKKKPKYVPLWLWRFFAQIFIDTKKLNKYLTEGIGAKSLRK